MGEDNEKILQTLKDIKKLLVLDLIVRGTKAADVAKVLNVSAMTISNIVSVRKIKK